VLVVEGAERGVGGFDEDVEAAFGESQVEVGDFAEDVAHRHVEGAALGLREAAQVLDEVGLEGQPVLLGLLDELLARKAERVARLPRDVGEEAPEARGRVRLLFEPDVAVDGDEAAQLLGRHLLVRLLRAAVDGLDAVERGAAGPEHAADFGEHGVLLGELDVAEHVEADDVVEAVVGEGEAREFGRGREVVAVAARGERALGREVDADERDALALEEREHPGPTPEVEDGGAGAHVVVDPHRPREADVEAVERAEVARVQNLVGDELRSVELRHVLDARPAVNIVRHKRRKS
jgi:hypothetical protein